MKEYANEEVKIFDDKTVKELLNTKKADGTFYTKQEIMDAKREGERLLALADARDLKTIKDNIANSMNDEAKHSFIEVYNMIDFDRCKGYVDDYCMEMKKLCSNPEEGDVIAKIIHWHTYSREDDHWSKLILTQIISYFKAVVKSMDFNNPLLYSDECIETIKKYINVNSKPKNESKKVRIKVTSIMPQKQLDKYGLEPGNVFASQKALAEYCVISNNMVSKWKKSHYIVEIKETPMSENEMKQIANSLTN